MRKWLVSGLAVLLAAGNIFPAVQTAQAAPDNSKVVISQVYGGGGNSGAEYKNDFIELYNPTNQPVDLTGWKVRYASATGSFGDSNNTSLTGTIQPGGYLLIQQVAGAGGTKDLPQPDLTGSIAMSGTNGKVDLVNNAGQVIDLVGYGTATGGEGSPASALSGSTAAIRLALSGAPAGSRGLDTDNNAADFSVGAPDPRNSSYGLAPDTASPVTAAPAPNAWPAGTEVTLSSPTVSASVYAAVYTSGNNGTYAPYSSPILINGDTTIRAYASEPNLPDSPVSEFSYTILSKTDIAAARTAPKSQNVATSGIVTHIDGTKTYIQDESGAIVLYNFPAFASAGDRVDVSGVMDIYSNLQELKPVTGLDYSVIEPNAGVPAPKPLTAADLSAANGEQHEAELVTLENVTITSKNGSTVTASQGGTTFTVYSGSAKLAEGKTFDRITGVVEQFNANYQLVPLNDNALVEETFSVTASPAAGRIIIGSEVTLSSPTVGAAVHYTLDGTDPTAASTLYTTPIKVDQDVTIKAVAVANGETSKVFSFAYVASEVPRIHDIQGESHTSDFASQTVTDVEGIVTQYGYYFSDGKYRGFFMQDPQPDNNPNTSEAIYVFSTNEAEKPAIGDLVSVTGKVSEYNEGSSSNLTSTQITPTSLKKLASGQAQPEPVVLGKGGRVIPSSLIDNDEMKEFQPEEDAIDFYESLEGMLVKLPTPAILSPYWTSGNGNSLLYNIPTRVDNDFQDVITPAGGLVLKGAGNLNPQRLLIAYSNPGMEVGTGDTFAGDVTGVIGYNNGNFKVIPANGSLPSITPNPTQQETTTLTAQDSKLLIASYNIENYYPGVGPAKTQKLAESITANMKKPDIIGVVEMQDGDGEADSGTVEADASALITAIQNAGGPLYKYVDIAPENKKDGGAPGGNIRVGFLYNPARVQLADSVNGEKGSATQAVAYDAASGKLTYNPGRIAPADSAFASSRKPLAAQFEFQGEQIIVIANHFNSKGGDNGPFGKTQPPVLSSETQRHQIAAIVNAFTKDILTANPDANIVALGDLNDFQFTETATILKGNELDNLIDKLPVNEQYTYTYDGNSQVLDHILVSKNLSAAAQVDVVHLNADFPASRGRVSDHDAVMAQIDFKGNTLFPLTVLHTNDTHANLDTTSSPNSVLRRVTAIKEAKASSTNPILVDAGDVFSGTLYFNKYLGQADLAFMNLVDYDAMTFGNHEFDKDSTVLSKFIDNAKFPFVSSNVNFSADEILSSRFKNEIGKPGADATIYPALIMEVDGEQIGLIGLTTEDTANIASPGAVTFDNAAAKASATVAMLQAEKINKIIVLSHLGYDEDVKLAKAVSGIDIIVGGHSHTKLDQAVVDHTDANAPKLIVQTGEKGQFLGKLQVMFSEDGVLDSWNNELISIDAKTGSTYNITEDPEAKVILDRDYKPGIQELSNAEVGTSNVVLNGVRNDVRTKETNLGNLIADGMLAAAKAAGTHAVIALQNGGGIRDSINAGPITQGEVLTVLPFNNDLVTITLTGQEIKEALENGVSKLPAADGRFPHVAGMRFYYDSTKPVNERVQRIEVKNGGTYVPLDLSASYEVATNAFTAKGGDFYASLEQAYKEGRVNLLYLPDYEVFTNYIQSVGTVTADTSAVEGRIVDLNGSPLPEEDFSLRILHTNDTHSHLETVVKRMTAIKQERTGNTLLLDAGDVFSGTLYFTKFEGLADLSFMNYIGYDAMTFGNHEFDKGLPALRTFVDKANFPLVSSNIDFTSKDNELKEIYNDTVGVIKNDASELKGQIYPAVVKEVYGEQVAIFGLTTEDTVGLSSPGSNITFEDYKTSAERTVAMLQAQGINKIIALSHLGYTVDAQLAEQVAGIDVIVGGHSHTKLNQPVVKNADGERTLIVQTGEYGQHLGELDVAFDDKGLITSYNGRLLDVSTFAEDQEAKAMLAKYDEELAEIRKTVVGNTAVELNVNRMIDGKSTRVVRKEETNLGNLIADGINSKSKELLAKLLTPADSSSIQGYVAIQNGGGIRAGINAGEITLEEVLTVMPFSNSLVALKVTGQELIDSLENSVSGLESDQGRFAQVSGMKYTYDSTRKAEIINPTTNELQQKGERIVSVEIRQADGSYKPVDPQAYYILSTNSFMAGGGDFYRSLAKAKADGRYYELYLPDYEVFTAYLEQVGTVTMGTEGRITDLKGGLVTPTPAPTTAPGGGGGGAGTGITPTATPAATATPGASTAPAVPAQVTTLAAEDLAARLAALPSGSTELVIPVTASAGGAQIVLPASVLIQQAAAQPNTVLTFTTAGTSYSLPLSVINVTALSNQLGTNDFTITVSMLQADTAILSRLKEALTSQQGTVTLAGPVIEFSVEASAGNKRIPMDSFGDTFVKRSISTSTALNTHNATGVVFDPAAGKLSFVPSVLSTRADGTTTATITRNSNSYYTVVQSARTFTDLSGHWAKSTVELLASKLIISGTSVTAFSPSQSVTRAEFAALITRSLGLATVSGGTSFSDVSSGKWYAGDIQTAAAAGLLSGYTDGTFRPDSPISRQEMASILAKAMKYTGKSLNADLAGLAKFSDAANLPDWSKAAVAEIAAEGIIQGTPDGSFAPQKQATRAEAATMLEKTLRSLQFIN
ncbi:5'-nucleotidase C-terminal domain-containing protein [Paenibacillus albidus]|uniref:5'-nucleotidase C-terminal domain-containing protein n=1 Tax=Paenibacillus albidus TaxID=2041023 RepID=UPI001E3C0356|nr:5'-nucleotidase C-terminal domain-containing protein [Paenibacillus albidus]